MSSNCPKILVGWCVDGVCRVRNKMEKGDGMSFSEFTYPLLQGWDWWHMYKTHSVQVQVGGADQYGNIVAGMDAVRFIAQSEGESALKGEQRSIEPMGLTVPLLTTASGEKFGKSAGNAIWLDLKMTSSFDLYGVRSLTCSPPPSYWHTDPTSYSFFLRLPTRTWSVTSSFSPSCHWKSYPKS